MKLNPVIGYAPMADAMKTVCVVGAINSPAWFRIEATETFARLRNRVRDNQLFQGLLVLHRSVPAATGCPLHGKFL
jgi:hypothetical protein